VSLAEDQLQLVDDCEQRESRLTDWERGFVDNVKARLEAGRPLTPLQVKTLDEIWERATARG
jgi:hypothetical protein